MRKLVFLFLKGIGLGLGIGLCLAGWVGLIYRAMHSATPDFNPGHTTLYFFAVGGVMGFFGGWCFSLQMVLGNLLVSLFMKVADLVPLPAQVVGEEWAGKMETFFREIIEPFPGFIRKFIEWIFYPSVRGLRPHQPGLGKGEEKGRRREDHDPMDADGDTALLIGASLAPLLRGLCYSFADQLCFLEFPVF